ncbi:MAG: mercury methylation corrinoid protein HgcA [Pseudomonadota bacterium]
MQQPFVVGAWDTPAGPAPMVEARLTGADRLGGCKARWGVGRMRYTVEPGLYALGRPGSDDPILVSANYKLSFDNLRAALIGRDAWILVLDTNGINVWCAAGKGSLGTDNLVQSLKEFGLKRIVRHRRVIAPQLAAPGIAAHEVRRRDGFRVVFGPVQATDLPAFLDAGNKASPAMRRKTFTLRERLVLVPIELVQALAYALPTALGLALLGALLGPGGFGAALWGWGLPLALMLLGAVLAGAVAGPLLLPWLPGRAFAMKGLAVGALAGLAALGLGRPDFLAGLGWIMISLSVSSFLLMNFTGASTYTSLSGVKREMRWAAPVQIGLGAAGLIAWLAGLILC